VVVEFFVKGNFFLRHRIVRNYKAEAKGISVEEIIEKLMG
jgi:hypothetical protein